MQDLFRLTRKSARQGMRITLGHGVSGVVALLIVLVAMPNSLRAESKKSGVQMDLSVIDSLGSTEPEPSTERIKLKKPGSSGAAAPAETDTPTIPSGGFDIARLEFAEGSADLPENIDAILSPVAARLQQNRSLRVQLLGFASGDGPSVYRGRRLALSRAMAVRSYLMERGIGETRAMVRALGDKTDETPLDRVDVVVVK